jgi:hypothetical protein
MVLPVTMAQGLKLSGTLRYLNNHTAWYALKWQLNELLHTHSLILRI